MLDAEKSKRLKEIDEELKRLYDERAEIECSNSGFFIGKVTIGDGDYWDEYYYPLGLYNNCNDLEEWKNKQLEEDAYDCEYFEVSREDYRKYQTLGKMEEALKWIRKIDRWAISELEEDWFVPLAEAYSKLHHELGLKYESFQHVCLRDMK